MRDRRPFAALKFGRWRTSIFRVASNDYNDLNRIFPKREVPYFEVKKKTSNAVVEPSFFFSILFESLFCFYFTSGSEVKQNELLVVKGQ